MSRIDTFFDNLIEAKELAKRIGISPKTLSNWRSMGKGPTPYRRLNRVYYKEAEVVAWLDDVFFSKKRR